MAWDTDSKRIEMKKTKIYHSKMLWILVLNCILIFIPLTGFYFIDSGNEQSLHRRTRNLSQINRSLTNFLEYGNYDVDISVYPVLAPYQRIILLNSKNSIIDDTDWIYNENYYYDKDTLFSKLLSSFHNYFTPPKLKQDEIIKRLSKYINQNTVKLGIIDYRYIYSVRDYNRNDGKSGVSIILMDKSDIMYNTGLNKRILLIVSSLSLIMATVFSFIYYRLFLKPLKYLTIEALSLKTRKKISELMFPMRFRKDEIGQLSHAFYSSVEELEKRKSLLEEFTSDVLHELKNPLTAIRNGVELLELKQDYPENLKDETKEIHQILSRETGRIEKLLFEIRELSLHDNRQNQVGTSNLVDVINEVATLYKKQGIILDLEKGNNQSIVIPRDKLCRVLTNLIDNAMDFSPEYGSVSINYYQKNEICFLSISDKGPGIQEDEKKRVFNRFYSNRPDGNRQNIHSGLGLSIVKKILESYNHAIECKDNYPTGTTFQIKFNNWYILR